MDAEVAETIYVKLLDEGTDVCRPVPALFLADGKYKIFATPNYNPVDEVWEFPPGSIVQTAIVEQSDGNILVAIKLDGAS